MAKGIDDRLDRYLAGELSPREQRELARRALDDPALFETLTAAALLKETTRRIEPGAAAALSWSRPLRNVRVATILGGAMAAAAAIALMIVSRPSSRTDSPPPDRPGPRASTVDVRAPSTSARTPLFLTARNEEQPAGSAAFRTSHTGSRPPKAVGTVTSLENGEIEVDLGSLDGVAKGSTLRLFQTGGQAAAMLQIGTVFRERSRGRITSGMTPHVGDGAEVAPSDYVEALLQHVEARDAVGDATAARQMAELAVSRADSGDVPAGVQRRALSRSGALEHAAGALDEAERRLRRAVDEFDAPPVATAADRADVLNELGAVLIDRHDFADAEHILRMVPPGSGGRAGVRIANNRGALATMRGDGAAAESFFRTALQLAGSSPEFEAERQVIRKNLDAIFSHR